ncbi:hypothetical protein BOX15_Mlig001680g1 [Macrostomum lignano]|uniref:Uncharacterized protein n=1 Tax=Macrostomum lignano TaxID=282301 RepID=A0A267H7D7_9PLAT|nr:hypothetical protein BOX15_Mlig001680g1 [Macrostomum lignano]
MEAFNSKASGTRILIAVFFSLLGLGLLSLCVSLAELIIGCLHLTRLRHSNATGNYRGVAIATYLIVSGIFGCLFSCLASCSCFRRDRFAANATTATVSSRGGKNNCYRCCLFTVASVGHLFSLAWLTAGFYWVYYFDDADSAPTDLSTVSSMSTLDYSNSPPLTSSLTTAAAAAGASDLSTSPATAAAASAARPLLWLRLVVSCLELAIVVAMLLCCNNIGSHVYSSNIEDFTIISDKSRSKISTNIVDSSAVNAIEAEALHSMQQMMGDGHDLNSTSLKS